MDVGEVLTSAVVAIVLVLFGIVFGSTADRFVRRTLRDNFVERGLAARVGALTRWVIWFWSFFGAADIGTRNLGAVRTFTGPAFSALGEVAPHLIGLAEWLALIVVLAHLLGRPQPGAGEG